MEENQIDLLTVDPKDSASCRRYEDSIQKLVKQISSEVQKLFPGKSKVTLDELKEGLNRRMPQNTKINIEAFKDFFEGLNVDENNEIELREFYMQYINTHEQLKLTLESYKNIIDENQKKKVEYEGKIFEYKNEPLNQYQISKNSKVIISINNVQLNNINYESEIYFRVECGGDSQQTESKPLDDLEFKKRMEFPVEKIENTNLEIYMYAQEEQNVAGHSSIPLSILTPSNESNPTIEIYSNGNGIGLLNPSITFITSYYDYYNKQLDLIKSDIEKKQYDFRLVAKNLDSISAPFKDIFDQVNSENLGQNVFQNKAISSIEGIIKNTFNKKEIKWIEMLKYCLCFCILTSFITTLEKVELMSMFIEIIFLFMVVTQMTQYFSKYFAYFLGFICVCILYDLLDYFILRNTQYNSMSTVRFWVKLFGFLGFFGKICWLISFWIAKVKVFEKGY